MQETPWEIACDEKGYMYSKMDSDQQTTRCCSGEVVWDRRGEAGRPASQSRKINKLRVFDGPALFRLPPFLASRTPPAPATLTPARQPEFESHPSPWTPQGKPAPPRLQ